MVYLVRVDNGDTAKRQSGCLLQSVGGQTHRVNLSDMLNSPVGVLVGGWLVEAWLQIASSRGVVWWVGREKRGAAGRALGRRPVPCQARLFGVGKRKKRVKAEERREPRRCEHFV